MATEVAYTEKEIAEMGSGKQTVVIEDYPTATVEQKLRVPYIEKRNGNILVSKD
jgi:hypothetical protein